MSCPVSPDFSRLSLCGSVIADWCVHAGTQTCGVAEMCRQTIYSDVLKKKQEACLGRSAKRAGFAVNRHLLSTVACVATMSTATYDRKTVIDIRSKDSEKMNPVQGCTL